MSNFSEYFATIPFSILFSIQYKFTGIFIIYIFKSINLNYSSFINKYCCFIYVYVRKTPLQIKDQLRFLKPGQDFAAVFYPLAGRQKVVQADSIMY